MHPFQTIRDYVKNYSHEKNKMTKIEARDQNNLTKSSRPIAEVRGKSKSSSTFWFENRISKESTNRCSVHQRFEKKNAEEAVHRPKNGLIWPTTTAWDDKLSATHAIVCSVISHTAGIMPGTRHTIAGITNWAGMNLFGPLEAVLQTVGGTCRWCGLPGLGGGERDSQSQPITVYKSNTCQSVVHGMPIRYGLIGLMRPLPLTHVGHINY